MTKIRRRESDPVRRGVLFVCNNLETGAPIVGATFYDIMISPNREHWRRSNGTVTEIGNGLYYFTPTRDEIDFVGALIVNVHHVTAGRMTVIAEIMQSDEHDDPQPSVWFTTEPA